jgi:hypothetical protein
MRFDCLSGFVYGANREIDAKSAHVTATWGGTQKPILRAIRKATALC